MYVSRSEARQQAKMLRKKRLRRLIYLNTTLLAIIIIGLVAWLAAAYSDEWKERLGISGGTGAEQAELPDPEREGDTVPSASPDGIDNTTGSEKNEAAGGAAETNEGEPESAAPSLDSDKVSLSFVGDLFVGEYVKALTDREGYDYLYQQAMLYLSEPDIMAGNLEFPITTRGEPVEGTPYVFNGSPEVLTSMKNAGFDIMSLANNHALDQGVVGMLDTMQYLDDAGISHMGAGSNDTEAFAPLIKEVRGVKIAYIGLSKVVPFPNWKADKNVAGVAETYDTTRAVKAISKAKEQADIVVVMVHWGKEHTDQLEPYQKSFAREYVDAGADLVIGSHPHVLQGFERYNGKWIAYSLGNFIFTSYPKETAGETGVLDALCTKNGECELKFNPMFITAAQPTPLEGDSAKALLDRLTSISINVQVREDGTLVSK